MKTNLLLQKVEENQSEAGFSMVELLATVAIIGVLAAVLFPAGSRMVESGKAAQCISNLRNLGMDARSYAAENNGILPWYDRSASVSGLWWHRIYSGDRWGTFNKLMVCPSDPKPYVLGFSPNGATLKASYRYNKYLGYTTTDGSGGSITVYPVQRLGTMDNQSKTPMIADYRNTQSAKSDDSLGFDTWGSVLGQHKKGTCSNVLCVDGHVETIGSDTSRLTITGKTLN